MILLVKRKFTNPRSLNWGLSSCMKNAAAIMQHHFPTIMLGILVLVSMGWFTLGSKTKEIYPKFE